MKIFLVGAQSTGKSTLARNLAQKYQLPRISETARSILSEQELHIDALRCDLDVADRFQQAVFDRQIEQELKYTDFVSDRSVIDILTYSGQHTRILPKLMQNSRLADCLDRLREPTSYLFFPRASKLTMKQDGVRETLTWESVIAIDAQIKLLLELFDLPYFQINTDSMQERIRLVTSILDK